MHKQHGSIIIVVLWTVTLLTILVTVIASQNRLAAQTAYLHQQDLQQWAQLAAAMNQAEMELMLERMEPAVTQVALDDLESLNRNPRYRYNGQPLALLYPQAQNIMVRIYDHAGKINLRELSRPRLRAMIEKKLGEDPDPDQVNELMSAWGDWMDLNDSAGPDGAETEYYTSLEPGYLPRNGRLETVEEILLIKGFGELFGDVDLDAAFTLYGESDLINLNLATVECMQLLPGLDDELIAEILAWRQENEFSGNGDVAQIVPAENMADLRPWLNSRRTSNHYSILVYASKVSDPEQTTALDEEQPDTALLDTATTALAEILEIPSATSRPRVFKINPYQRIPIRYSAPAEE